MDCFNTFIGNLIIAYDAYESPSYNQINKAFAIVFYRVCLDAQLVWLIKIDVGGDRETINILKLA